MAVGTPVTKGQIDSAAGGVARSIEMWLPQVLSLKEYLDATPDADLMDDPFGYSAEDVALLKSAIGDLAQLARIYNGEEALPEAKDFGQFARRLAGLVLV